MAKVGWFNQKKILCHWIYVLGNANKLIHRLMPAILFKPMVLRCAHGLAKSIGWAKSGLAYFQKNLTVPSPSLIFEYRNSNIFNDATMFEMNLAITDSGDQSWIMSRYHQYRGFID